MRRFFSQLVGGRLQMVLITSFSFVAALTVIVNALVIAILIHQYLAVAQGERVGRDMDLADAFYQFKLEEISAVGNRMVRDPQVVEMLPLAFQGHLEAIRIIEEEVSRKITVPTLGGTHFIAILDHEGDIFVARVLSGEGELSPEITEGNWGSLPIVEDVIGSGKEEAATEIIPFEFLTQVGLDQQAFILLKETPKAAPQPFDMREGTAGLALTCVYPFLDENDQTIGAVLVAYMFNNDFTLVDRIKEVAGVDTVTIFFGDLRVSTNVPDEEGKRAVGTRVSQVVYDTVLNQGLDYSGTAFVVNENYITRYEPLLDHQGQVVGILYVGARASAFEKLLQTFYNRVALIALICIMLAAVIAVPIVRFISNPIATMVDATGRLARGDMTVRVDIEGKGELAVLGRSFNTMVETLHRTQQELLHKEKLASMGQLAAGVAHEINNPLGSILLFSDVMYKEVSEDDPRREDLRMIINETTRCKRIVADLLNFARQQEVLAQDTDVHTLLEQVIESIRYTSVFEEVEIIRQFSSELPSIQADPAQLQQVFVNLMNNAAEAMEGGGTITLTTRPIDTQWVEVKISDTGCGIPEENLGKLFTPFFTTKPQGKGTGLGLSIVYGILKMHRAQISVQSEIGVGTTFTLLLPVRMLPGQLSTEGSPGNENI